MPRISRAYLYATLLSAAVASSALAQSVTPRPHLAPGCTAYIETTTQAKQTIQNPAGGQPMSFQFEILTGLLRRVESADADGAKLTHRYDRQRIKADSPMMSGEFDSDIRTDDEGLEFAEIFSPLIGESYTIELGPDHMVKTVSGMDKIADKMRQEAGFNPMVAQFTREMTNEQTADELNAQFGLYANKEIKTGDKWSKTLTREAGPLGKTTAQYEFTADKVTAEQATVSYTATMKQESPAADTGNPGIKALHLTEGKITGTAVFDGRTGALTKDEQTTQIKVELELAGAAGGGDDGEQAAPRLAMEADVKQTVTVMSEADRAKQKAEHEAKAKEMKAARKKPETPESEPTEPDEPKKP
jgi:hypothetical protein